MNRLLAFLVIFIIFNSCSESESSNDIIPGVVESNDDNLIDAPRVRSYSTYITQNSVILNGFIDHSNVTFGNTTETFKVGFILRYGDENDSSNDQIIELENEIQFANGQFNFTSGVDDFDSLEPNTTYYYTAFTKNGSSEEYDWESFTTSAIPCDYNDDNYYSISDGVWTNASVSISDPQCCDEGNIGFRFGQWPNIFEINFNELNNGYPKTGQYYGVDYAFDISSIERELLKSTNQVLIENTRSTTETELFVNNDGETITLIFCNTVLRDGSTLNGKVSAQIPQN